MEQQRITLANGIELDVVDVGPRDAPALIFLHGFPESHRTWRHQIAHLPRAIAASRPTSAVIADRPSPKASKTTRRTS